MGDALSRLKAGLAEFHGRALERVGALETALEHYEAYLDAHEDDDAIRRDLLILLRKHGRTMLLRRELDRLWERGSASAGEALERLALLLALGERALAEEAVPRLCDLDPGLDEIEVHLPALRAHGARDLAAALFLPLAVAGNEKARSRLRELIGALRARSEAARALEILQAWPEDLEDDDCRELRLELHLAMADFEGAHGLLQRMENPELRRAGRERSLRTRDLLRLRVCETVLRGGGLAGTENLPPSMEEECRRLHDSRSQHAHVEEIVEIHLRMGQFEQALFHLQQLRPAGGAERFWSLARRAMVWLRLGRLASALRDLEELGETTWKGGRRRGLSLLYDVAVAALERGLHHAARSLLERILLVDLAFEDAATLLRRLEGEENEEDRTRPLPSVSIARAFDGHEPVEAILGGRYVLHRQVERRGRSTMWTATDELARRPVRVLRCRFEEPALRREALRQARRAQERSIEGALRLLDLIEGEDRLDLILERREGESLRNLVLRGADLAELDLRDLVVQMARSLRSAWTQGVVHPGLSADCFIRLGPRQWMLDGCGQLPATEGDEELVASKLLILSPEALREEAPTEASLVHSLGAALRYRHYEGGPPSQERLWELLRARWAGEETWPAETLGDPAIPPLPDSDLSRCLAAMLAFEGERRPSLDQIIDQLGEEGSAEPSPHVSFAGGTASSSSHPSLRDLEDLDEAHRLLGARRIDDAKLLLERLGEREGGGTLRRLLSRWTKAVERQGRIETLRCMLEGREEALSGSEGACRALELASLLREDGAREEALRLLQGTRKEGRTLVGPWTRLKAELWEDMGFDGLALAEFEAIGRELFVETGSGEALHQWGRALERAGRPSRARELYEAALKVGGPDEARHRIRRIDVREATLMEGAPRAEPLPGTTFDGRFEILEELGAGGMGVVYRVRNLNGDVIEALKILTPRQARRPEFVDAFLCEMRLLASLHHGNIVALRDLHAARGRSWYSMELLQGASLAERIRDEGPMALREFFAVAGEILAGLAHAHGQGIVHRDLKPENLRWESAGGRLKLTDFGLGLQLRRSSSASRELFLGTAQYVSPEQIEGEGVGFRSDIYSLGIVFFEMLTGVVPFGNLSTHALFHAHLHHDPPSPKELRQEIPHELAQLVGRCLSKDPESRPRSASELARCLQELELRFGHG